MPKVMILALLVTGGFRFCSQEQNTNIVGPSSPGTSLPGDPCSGLTTTVNVDVESGLDGADGIVGTAIVFSADPRDAEGRSIPNVCRTGTVTATATGACNVIQGTPTLENITTIPGSVGTCRVDATYGGVTGGKTVPVIAAQ